MNLIVASKAWKYRKVENNSNSIDACCFTAVILLCNKRNKKRIYPWVFRRPGTLVLAICENIQRHILVGILHSHSPSTWQIMGLRYGPKTTILTLLSSKGQYLGLIYFKNLPKNENVRKYPNNNNSDNPVPTEVKPMYCHFDLLYYACSTHSFVSWSCVCIHVLHFL